MALNTNVMLNNEAKIVEIETLWTSYRKLLLGFIGYLHDKGKEEAFKMFFSGSIPDKYWDVDIEIWLRKLEQSGILNMNQLEILSCFLKLFDDSDQMSSKISEFRCLLKVVEVILSYGSDTSKDITWIYDPPIKIEKFRISEELLSLIKQWEKEIKNTPNISKELITEMYSKATQRIMKVASESNQSDHLRSLEAIFIAQFLTKIEGMAQWLSYLYDCKEPA